MTVHSLPQDLVPLPTMPYDVRPESMPLTIDEARTALWKAKGNITEAAKYLKVDSGRLRRFVKQSVRLSMEADEARQQILDKAETIIVEALEDTEDRQRQDNMAKFALLNLGMTRGYGAKTGKTLNVNNSGSGNVIVTWGDGSTFDEVDDEPDALVIDHNG